MVSGALPLGQAVLITDACQQIFEACDPGPRLFSSAGHQVQGLHVLSVVQAEAAVGVEAALRVALEDLRLLTLTHLPDGVNGDCWRKQEVGESVEECSYFYLSIVRDYFNVLYASTAQYFRVKCSTFYCNTFSWQFQLLCRHKTCGYEIWCTAPD